MTAAAVGVLVIVIAVAAWWIMWYAITVILTGLRPRRRR